jgi:cytochrome c-type biogenesis protein
MTGVMTFAFGAGLLATVNPCGFVMLPGFIGMQLGAAEEAGQRTVVSRCAQGLGLGLVLSGAFSVVLVLAGLGLAAGLRVLVARSHGSWSPSGWAWSSRAWRC